ncbi:hypothetical protein B0F90DRAFT_1953249 [Multifurca ochricompacta]|uniref:CMP/dCMP-type deaminase domain-containing protein n=1 Tax=Multifurca ochricompacta TaxID=376703 RepID=A0AAD4LZZ6_9AGAM|nr:hypothetical protein B0F90DRAFT_1953249 [Multifurca ochricompacta]
MSKNRFYLSQCADAASKSPMCFTLGAVLVKGGKVISSGYNHHRPHYDGAEVRTRGHRKPVSMHAEMHAIFSLTGMSPSFRKQQGAHAGASPQLQTPYTSRPVPPPPPPPPPRASPVSGSMSCERRRRRRQKKWKRSGSRSRGDSGSESHGVASGVRSGKNRARLRAQPSDSAFFAPRSPPAITEPEKAKAWSARRRDPRINGGDIYVARVTKVGMGSAKPCWRCVEWCRWAGVKRIFHWNGEDGKFDMVKVNTAARDQYETHADIRLYAGMGW